jgi:hypothetical protein
MRTFVLYYFVEVSSYFDMEIRKFMNDIPKVV